MPPLIVIGEDLPTQDETQHWAPAISPESARIEDTEQYGLTGLTGTIGGWIRSFIEWLLSPVCDFFNSLLNLLGMPNQPAIFAANQGAVGYCLGVADAWAPLHEMFTHAMVMLAIVVLWTPFAIVVKYFLPGLGG